MLRQRPPALRPRQCLSADSALHRLRPRHSGIARRGARTSPRNILRPARNHHSTRQAARAPPHGIRARILHPHNLHRHHIPLPRENRRLHDSIPECRQIPRMDTATAPGLALMLPLLLGRRHRLRKQPVRPALLMVGLDRDTRRRRPPPAAAHRHRGRRYHTRPLLPLVDMAAQRRRREH